MVTARTNRRPLRLLLVIDQFPPLIGGAERQAELLCRELASRGHDLEVLTLWKPGLSFHEHRHGFLITRVPAALDLPKLRYPASLLDFTLGVRSRLPRVDIVQVVQAIYPAFCAVLAARGTTVPVVVKCSAGGELFDLTALARDYPLGRYMVPLLARGATRFVAVAPHQHTDLALHGIEPTRIATIPNGVVLPAILDPGRRAARRRALGFTAAPLWLCLGRLIPIKGHCTALEAFALLPRERRGTLVLLGDGPLQPALAARAAQPDLAGSVEVLGARAEALDYLSVADYLLQPSLLEGLSNAVLEALAAGVPVVASDLPSHRYLQGLGASPPPLRLCPPGDPGRWRDAMVSLLENPGFAREVGASGRALAEQHFALSGVTDRYEALYAGLLSASSTKATPRSPLLPRRPKKR